MTLMQKVMQLLSQPKYYSPHYNVNGKRVFTSKFTIVWFSIICIAFMCYKAWQFVPVLVGAFADYYVSTEYKTLPLTTMVDIGVNKTIKNPDGFWDRFYNIWLD